MIINLLKRAALCAVFKFKPFSKKQTQVLNWWTDKSPVNHYDGIIADGAVRSGKTLSMSMSYIFWAMEKFDFQNFALCGKSVTSLRRNVWKDLKIILLGLNYKIEELKTENLIVISKKGKTNFFYIFGGKDERSQDFIQGITLAGVFFDEVALMPESFVNQATARCSIEGAKLWFNCNPDSPNHWFKKQWLDEAKNKKILHLHFLMDDNLSLSEKVKNTYRNRYVGVFFKRFILGLWIMAEGAIFDMLDEDNYYEELPGPVKDYPENYQRFISVDYGTTNPMVFADYYLYNNIAYQEHLYYYDSRANGKQKTDSEYADDFDKFVGNQKPIYVIIDPSASSFKVELRKRGYVIKDADNDVLEGIRVTSTIIGKNLLKINKKNQKAQDEMTGYAWDDKARLNGEEKPVKTADHVPDAYRYFIKTMFNRLFKYKL